MQTKYTQNGIELATETKYNSEAQKWETRPLLPRSDRFYPVVEYTDSQTIAEWLREHCSASQALLREMASGMSIAEIGGYWFFEDGSELAI